MESVIENVARRQRLQARFASDLTFLNLLRLRFEKEIAAAFAAGQRVVTVVFASSQRVEEWLDKGDCSTPVALVCQTPSEQRPEFVAQYRGLQMVAADATCFALVLATSLPIPPGAVQTWSVTAVRARPLPDDEKARLQGQFAAQLKLKVVVE